MKNPTKLWLLMLTSASVSLLIFISLIFLTGKVGDKGYNLNDLNDITETIIARIQHDTTFNLSTITPIIEEAQRSHPELRFEWVGSDGSTLYDTANEYIQYDFELLASRMLGMPHSLWGSEEPITLTYSLSNDSQTNYLLIGLTSEAMKEGQIYFFVRSFKILLTIIIPLIIAFIIPYLFSLWFIYSMNKRISKLNYAMSELNLRSEMTILEIRQKDEIGQLFSHYNEMAKRIQTQTEQIKLYENRRKILLSNLSHDLRTPLTMILGYAERIRTGLYKNEQELQANAKILLQRSRYMNTLLDQLLDLSEQDEQNLVGYTDKYNVSELLRKISADYIMYLEGQDFVIDIMIPDDDIIAEVDAALMERAIRNLIDNAIRYGSDGNYLAIKLSQNEDYISISVLDKGCGIPFDDQQYIFDRFYRVNSSRNGEGLGIGLSIVKEIVAFHSGTVTMNSTTQQTIFEIQLPKTT